MSIPKESITTVVFDAHGTLWEPNLQATFEHISSKLGIPKTHRHIFKEHLINSLLKLPHILNDKMITTKLLADSLNFLIHDTLKECNVKAMDIIQALCVPTNVLCSNPNGKEILDTIMYLWKCNYRIILKSNWPSEVQVVKLREFKLFPYFEAIYGPLGSYFKPNEKGAKKFLNGLNPEHFIMIGDSITYDIKFAKNTGMYSIWLNQNHKKILQI